MSRHGIAASPDLGAGGSERHRCGCTHCGCSANVQGRAASSSSATTWDGSKKSGKTACASSLAPCRTLLVAAMLESRWHINIKKNCPELGVFVRNICRTLLWYTGGLFPWIKWSTNRNRGLRQSLRRLPLLQDRLRWGRPSYTYW